ncbi:hypothetical protein ET495_09815 [Xylanimonas allomyrinae]|uniref:Uncharacterized protein n=1 Tax=Xylanimonas allomyrinae TaxID=2509459 RepID=A0A4P6EL76_9MICO|nr:hypothetical protein [Xylanimonas allomyrinae]QAY63500.1 hypothetical protein ET495_09815 [Xylanimonas allomyrinae]
MPVPDHAARRVHAGERGAASIESLGAMTVAVVLVIALTVSFLAFDLGPKIAEQLCRIGAAVSGSSAAACGDDRSPARSAEDYVPPAPCVVTGDGSAVNASVAVAVQVDMDTSFLVEQLNDGQMRITVQNSSGVGAEVGVGFDVSATVDDNRYGAAASAGATAGITSRMGDVYYASTPDEVDDVISALMTDATKDAIAGSSGPVRAVVDWGAGLFGADPREPDATFQVAGVDAAGSAAVTLVTMDASAAVEAGIYEGRTTYKDGRTTDVYTASASGSARASGLLGNGLETDDVSAVASFSGTITVEIDRDEDDNPVAMRLVRNGMAAADVSAWSNEKVPPRYTETTWQVPLDSTSDKQTAARVLWGLGIDAAGVNDSLGPIDLSGLNYAASWQDLHDLAKADGYDWTQEYVSDSSTYGGTFDAKWLLEAGLSGGYTTTSRSATGYTYWNGVEYVSRPACVA